MRTLSQRTTNNTNITKKCEKSKYILDRNAKKYQKKCRVRQKKQPPNWAAAI
jgi:hypothetical protein